MDRRGTYLESIYSMKLWSAVTTASIRDLNLMQDFSTVFLARNPITSLIKGIRSLVLWEDLL
jgi:hypothetical protein